ncbi:MAG: hypothetical protein L6366_07495, partial [Candidatus Omnitrophica bacterium]|nr:hypothetical protein [Candidatus Omnitrophota bacterium]
KKFIFLLLTVCVLYGITIRLFVLYNSDHLDFESVFRVQDSYRFAKHPAIFLYKPVIINSGTGGQSAYYFLNSLLLFFIDKPVLITRLTSLVFGILSIISFFYLLQLAFPLEISLASTFMLSSYYIHAQLSTTQFANSGAIFFAISACYFLLNHMCANIKNRSKNNLIYAAIFTLLATSFRMEMWLLAPLFTLISIKTLKPTAFPPYNPVGQKTSFFNNQLKTSFAFLIISSLYIIHTLIMFKTSRENCFSFLNTVLFHTSREKTNFNILASRPDMPLYGKYQISIWLNSLIFSLSHFAMICGTIGIQESLKKRKQGFFFIIFSAFFLMLTMRQLISNHFPFIRYSSILAIFFIPFIFSGIRRTVIFLLLISKQGSRVIKTATAICLVFSSCFFANYSLTKLADQMGFMQFQKQDHVYSFSNWMRRHAQPGDIIITSFSALTISASAMLNKIVVSDPHIYDQYMLFSIFDYLTKNQSVLYNKAYEEISSFEKSLYLPLLEREINIRVLTDIKNPLPKPKRVIFALNEASLTFLQKNQSVLLQKVKLKYDGFVYSGILSLD